MSPLLPGSHHFPVFGDRLLGRLSRKIQEHMAKQRRVPYRFLSLLLEGRRRPVQAAIAGLVRHPPSQGLPLLKRPEGGPQGLLQRFRLFRLQTLDRPSMAHAAAKPDQITFAQLPQAAAAIGTGEPRWDAWRLVVQHRRVELGDGRFLGQFRRNRIGILRDRILNQAYQHGTDLGERKAIIDFHVVQGALRHAGRIGIRRILHDRDAVLLLDRGQAGRAVVQGAGE